jgi:hypothetical protein
VTFEHVTAQISRDPSSTFRQLILGSVGVRMPRANKEHDNLARENSSPQTVLEELTYSGEHEEQETFLVFPDVRVPHPPKMNVLCVRHLHLVFNQIAISRSWTKETSFYQRWDVRVLSGAQRTNSRKLSLEMKIDVRPEHYLL